MKVLDVTQQIKYKAGIVAFGFFDAIHVGHKKVISDAVALARSLGVPSSVFMFKNNIFPLLGIDKHPLNPFETRVELIEKLGVDQLLFVEANRGFLRFSVDEFFEYLDLHLIVDGFTCGKDFTFGKNGVGTPVDLARHFGDQNVISDLYLSDGEKVSTEAVKTALLLGDIQKVTRFLGENYTMSGVVKAGRRDGGRIGFPTVNFEVDRLPLKRGVYFTNLYVDGSCRRAVTNVGSHPTFDDARENVESHILDYKGDLYGKTVKVEFLSYHRGIIPFNGTEALVSQITADVQARRDYD